MTQIHKDQVMLAHRMGAKIESSAKQSIAWVINNNPSWNWIEFDYRIANLTADGMLLDELVEKFPETIELKEALKYEDDAFRRRFSNHKRYTYELILFLTKHPNCIAQVSVVQEKKYRPWTMEEFETHRDEWFRRNGDKFICRPSAYNKEYVMFFGTLVSYEQIINEYERLDGSPCGEIIS